jgi:riboflavin synthase
MFTGIVEALGTVAELRSGPAGARLAVTHPLGRLPQGASISVNGCCVTVTDADDDRFVVDLMGETLDRTALGRLQVGDAVDLERALAADGRLGGHLVQGHVDGVGTISARTPHDAWTVVSCAAPARLAPYLVEKGSITIDGVSLTVMEVQPVEDATVTFRVGLIPHTLEVTVLGRREVGDAVNLEVDVIAKYVERLLRGGVATPYSA